MTTRTLNDCGRGVRRVLGVDIYEEIQSHIHFHLVWYSIYQQHELAERQRSQLGTTTGVEEVGFSVNRSGLWGK